MTREQFLEFHSGYYGELVDNTKQLVVCNFSGEELYEYTLASLKFKSDLENKSKKLLSDCKHRTHK